MKTAPNHVVGISYTLTENGSADVIEKVGKEDPFVFLLGVGSLLEAFESNISNLGVGDTFDFVLQAEDAYGVVDANAVVNVPIDVFIVNGKLLEDHIQPGRTVRLQDQHGNPLIGVVQERALEHVRIDFNHPMAGKALHFTGEIVSVRPATAEELDHGHVHGPGGHHH